MSTETGHSSYCRKEKEIAEIYTDLKTVKKAVMGNGKDGLIITVPVLSQTVEKLDETVGGLQKGLSGFLRFQENLEGNHEGKVQAKRKSRWVIGLLVGALSTLVGLLIYTIHLLSQTPA